ncbi:protein NETWORKED 3B-like isoform X2 [Neltuma alba]|uniref:protein NETWORKED 3B-like isoform X2 n=1 Tax=Neltuma alba TaxID=207710 RepID=UPI0010A3A1B0|nr:protein NETWORKED 3B-like isoform X2 [Prosopis alba]
MKNAKGEDTTASFSWWQDSHSRPPQSPWLQATLSDLDEKTKVMVSIIDQNDGDSFSRRAETFYMRRPELVGTIRNVHRSYGSLARRRRLGYDEIKAVSEEKKVEVEIADTRLRVLKLAEGNLYEQAELTRKNNHDREAIRLFCTRVQRLVNEEHRDPNSFLRTPSSTSPP